MEFYEQLVLKVIENHPLIDPQEAANKATEYYNAAVEKWNDISLRSVTDAEHPQYSKPAKKESEEKVDNQLHLVVDSSGWLCVNYKDNVIISINTEGKLYGPSSFETVEEYEEWLEHKKFSNDVVEWRGKKYKFCYDSLYCETDDSFVYHLKDGRPVGCSDDNIKRYSNGTPILF